MKRVRARWSILALGAAGLVTGCSSSTGGQGSAVSVSSAASPSPKGVSSSSVPGSSAAPGSPSVSGTVGSSPATPAATPPTAGVPLTTPAGVLGSWHGHGRALVVSADGTVTMNFRTYVNCTATVTTGCDQITGSAIHDGGHVIGQITHVLNPTTVIVTVTFTSDPAALPLGPVRFGHDLGHHAVAPFAGQLSGTPFCGPGAPSGYCGA